LKSRTYAELLIHILDLQ